MRAALIELLDRWTYNYVHYHPDDDDNNNEDIEQFDRNITALVMFLKKLAVEVEDIELLGKAARLEIHIKERSETQADTKIRTEKEQRQQHAKKLAFNEQVKQLCIQYFYTEKAFVVDMSKYQRIVDKYAASFADDKALSKLRNYINEKDILDSIYTHLEPYLGCIFFDKNKLPAFEDIQFGFSESLDGVYRRADVYVARAIAKQTNISVGQITSELKADEGKTIVIP